MEPKLTPVLSRNLLAWGFSGITFLVVGGVLVLGACAFGQIFGGSDLPTFLQTMQTLAKEQQRAQQLDALFRMVPEIRRQADQVVIDLIQRQCSLREAATRFRAFLPCSGIGWEHSQAVNEEERVILHLFYRVGLELKDHSSEREQVLRRLQIEWGQLRKENAAEADSPAKKEMPPLAL
jgi:hypothetical protein